jgi:hypothetical protein
MAFIIGLGSEHPILRMSTCSEAVPSQAATLESQPQTVMQETQQSVQASPRINEMKRVFKAFVDTYA